MAAAELCNRLRRFSAATAFVAVFRRAQLDADTVHVHQDTKTSRSAHAPPPPATGPAVCGAREHTQEMAPQRLSRPPAMAASSPAASPVASPPWAAP
eukprot:scaffold35321_cov64-Phaeocystis_antarctica.AAC.2